MASDIMQQVQEDSRKKKQQGVLSRMSDQPDQQGMGTGTRKTPEPTVVEKAKEVQKEEVVAEPKIEDPRSMSDRDRRMAQVAAAAEGARYRAALQPKKGFEEQYDADVKFQEEEYGKGTGSLERDRMLAEIMGQEYQTDPDPVGVEGTITDRDLYEKYYAEAKEKNPSAQKEQLQDAAIKGVMAEQAERAALEAEKFPEPLEAEATETVGAGLGYEKTIEELRQEKADREAAAKKKETDIAKAAADTIKSKGRGGTTPRKSTPEERAARIAALRELEKRKLEEAEKFSKIAEEKRAELERLRAGQDTVDETTTPAATPKQNATVSLLESYSPRQQQAVLQQPGGANFIEALDSLEAASKGDVSALMRFEEAFGDRTAQGGKDMSRRQFLSRIPPVLRDSFGDSLRSAVRASEPKVSKGLESQLSRNLYESVSNIKGVPSDEAQAEIDKTAKELQKVFLNHSEMRSTGSMTGGVTKFMGLDSVGEAKRAELVNDLMEKIGIRKGLLESLGASPSLARPSDVFANNPELRNQVLAFNRASDLLNTSNFIPAAEGTSAPTAARTSGTIPQEALDKYPIYADADDDFTGLVVSADYGDNIKDLPEGKQFSHTIFPGNFDNLPPEQRYEYVVTTDGTKYLYTTNPEDLDYYSDPVEVTEVTELSPSESIIASAAEGS